MGLLPRLLIARGGWPIGPCALRHKRVRVDVATGFAMVARPRAARGELSTSVLPGVRCRLKRAAFTHPTGLVNPSRMGGVRSLPTVKDAPERCCPGISVKFTALARGA